MPPRKIKLWKSFWVPLANCFLLAIPMTLLLKLFWGITSSLFGSKGKIENYAVFLPPHLKKENWFLSKGQFIGVGILIVVSFFLAVYFYELQVRKLIIRIVKHLKNRSLEKFRNLPLEEKLKRKGEINNLTINESWWISHYWVNFWTKIFEGSFELGIFFYTKFKLSGTQHEISNRMFFFTLFWLLLISGTVYLLYKINFRFKQKSKKATSEEQEVINREVNHSILISSMGLEDDYKKKQRIFAARSARQNTLMKKLVGLEIHIPWKLVTYLFPFVLLIIEPNFIGTNFFIVWDTLCQGTHKFSYLAHWSEYTAPRALLDKFLTLPEKDNNLKGIKLPTSLPIEKITFEQVAFKYQGSNNWINYNNTFQTGKINYLSAPNGSGKTTQLYLLLGLISPVKGEIIIQNQEKKCKLSELNLKHWRHQNVAYCSYQTLIKEGSTGQKQLANLKQVLKTKNQAQIFIFDEADNALDQENQIWFQTQLKKLVEKNKLVIRVRQLQKD